MPETTSASGISAAYAATITPIVAASKPISTMNNFSTGTQNATPEKVPTHNGPGAAAARSRYDDCSTGVWLWRWRST